MLMNFSKESMCIMLCDHGRVFFKQIVQITDTDSVL